jgi:hypothetical protein
MDKLVHKVLNLKAEAVRAGEVRCLLTFLYSVFGGDGH